jgi:DNA mismatch repair protein MutL
LLSIERHATSKIRKAADLEAVRSMGFRGEALASIAAVSRFELVTRRAKDASATRIRVDGGILRDVEQVGAPVGTRVSVHRLYFNTPVRAKFLKGITTELGHCIDAVQRHALAREGVGFQFTHNDKVLLDIPEHSSLRERVALLWGLHFAREMIDFEGERGGFHFRGLVGMPSLSRAQRSHQFFFMNHRPVVNRTLQFGFEDAYRGLLTIGRHPVGVLLIEVHPRFVDVNIHPAKREIRFRDDRTARNIVRDLVRERLAMVTLPDNDEERAVAPAPPLRLPITPAPSHLEAPQTRDEPMEVASPPRLPATTAPPDLDAPLSMDAPEEMIQILAQESTPQPAPEQAQLPGFGPKQGFVAPDAVYRPVEELHGAPMQVFDTYLLVPSGDRLLIIDQHALHERLNYDSLTSELEDHGYQSQQLAVPIVFEVAPSQVGLVERNLELFAKLGVDIEAFGGNTFQITGVCHLYEESRLSDLIFRVLDELAQGDLFDRENFMADVLRLATRACKASVRAGDRLSVEERRGLLEGFRRLRPPYTCPHGRPIITELTQRQMEKSFRRIQ